MPSAPFLSTFASTHPVLAMLHLKGDTSTDRYDRARREIDLLWDNGVDAVVVENYFGDVDDQIAVCEYLRTSRPEVTFGLNVLDNDALGFELADTFGAHFLQLDSVAGHLPPGEDEEFAAWLAERRSVSSAYVLGGVWFKYQPYRSGRSLDEDLRLGAQRCDAVVVTGAGTGLETPIDKIVSFRQSIGEDVALIVGAGVTTGSAAEQLSVADGVVVGSALKDTYVDTGEVSASHVREFVGAVRRINRTTPQRTIIASDATDETFAEFGRLVRLDGTPAPGVVVTTTPDWGDAYSEAPIIDSLGSIGQTRSEAAPWTVERMERHLHTAEATICTSGDLVLAVAPARHAAPRTAEVRAFVIPKDTVAVLHRGVWHDACHGAAGAADYIWFADCSVDEPEGWVTVTGGPVRVELASSDQQQEMS